MDFVREIMEPDKLAGIINIPKNLRRSRVEVIILPAADSSPITSETTEQAGNTFGNLYKKPIKVDKIQTFSRDKLHER